MKIFNLLLFTLLSSLYLTAQEREFMLIEKKDGTLLEFNIKDIQRFFFEQRPVTISPEIGGTVAEPVDLGLSVKWANWNMGANQVDEIGKKFYPGDVVGNMDKETALVLQLPYNYCGTQYDIATTNWGDEWRLPNAVDWKELYEKCKWEVICNTAIADMIENPYFDFVLKVTGPNGNSITFPFTADDDTNWGWSHVTWPWTTFNRGGLYDYMCGNNDISTLVGAVWEFFGTADGSNHVEEQTINQGICNQFNGNWENGPYVRPVMGESTKAYMNLSCDISLKDEVYVKCRNLMNGYEFCKNVEERGWCYSATNETPSINTDECIKINETKRFSSVVDTIIGPMADETTFYVRAYAKVDGELYYSDTEIITTSKALPVFTNITEGKLVDLGLHVKWASCNLGTNTPIDNGTIVAWDNEIRKEWGKSIECIYNSEHDYAHTQLSNDWRMPTYTELCELRDSCEWTLGFYNEKLGYKVTGKNGNSIFIPTDIYLLSGSCSVSEESYYMSTKQNLFGISVGNGKECYIRPVQGEPYVELFKFSAGQTPNEHRQWAPDYSNTRIGISAYGLDKATKERRLGICFSSEPNISFSENNFTEILQPIISGKEYIVKINNLQPGSTYYYRGVAILDGVIYYTSEGSISTSTIDTTEFPGEIPEAIDLGLSVKWSSWNFSASKPSEKGGRYNLFASMIGQNMNYNHMTDDFSYRMYDDPNLYKNITEGDEDIVDYVYGNGWRIPTKDEWQELIDNCTWEKATIDNVNGCKVTGKNGNSIFLPFCGYSKAYKDEYIYPNSTETDYWTATRVENQLDYYIVNIFEQGLSLNQSWLGDFMWIRPVNGNPKK